MRRVDFAIIGFAGGHVPSQHSLTHTLFDRMVARAERIVTEEFALTWDRVHLISGGAPWSDHIAVVLFLNHVDEGAALTVLAPSEWDDTTGRFVDNGSGPSWKTNPGRCENALHERFARCVGRDPFIDLRAAAFLGATIDTTYLGFHARNTGIAQRAQRLLAFSWSDGGEPQEGGTRDTWNKCRSLDAARKRHVPMTSLAAAV